MKSSEYPITSLRWKPYLGTKPKNIITTVTADGRIDFWHYSSGKLLYTLQEADNPIMCVDFNSEGNLFATGGNDKQVRLYDDNMKTLITTMKSNSFQLPGHSNRVFSVIFHKDNDNVLLSGGWDKTIQIYDVREKNIVASIYGPHICGDAIDIKGNKILTASSTCENQIQIFDLRTYKIESIVNLSSFQLSNNKPTFAYTCQFAKFKNTSDMFAVGGSSENMFATLEYENFNRGSNEIQMQMRSRNVSKSVYSIDFACDSTQLAVGLGGGSIQLIDYQEKF